MSPIKINRIICVLLLSSICLKAAAQLDSLSFYSVNMLRPEDAKRLDFCIDNLNFIRDNEYKGSMVKGYTLPGIWILPKFTYQPLRNLKLEVGAYLLRYWGANVYPNLNYSDLAIWKGEQYQKGFHALPFFRVQYRPHPTLDIILGHYYGRNNHKLIEPLYNPEMGLTADPEAGIQILWNVKPFSLDAWVNWESFIFQDDTHQEAFTFGLSTRFKFNKPTSPYHFYIPLQGLFQHRGGEINTEEDDKSRQIKTWLNAAIGFGTDININRRILKKANIEADYAYFSQQAGTLLPFDKGFGIQARASVDLCRFRLIAGYWQSKDFVTIFGNPHFGCMSVIPDADITYDDPKMIFFKVQYSQDIAKGF